MLSLFDNLGLGVFGVELNYTLRNVIFGSAVLGAVGGVIGCFAVLRRQSLVGDTLAHAALPGICLAFMVTGSRTTGVLMLGAAITGWLGTLALLGIIRGSRVKPDAALGIVLSVFFGVGTLLLTHIAQSGDAAQAGLDRFLFGQAASLVAEDAWLMLGVGAVVLGVVAVLFKEFKLLSFDPDFAASIGLPTTPLSILLTTLIVVAVVIGLQAVGVILMVTVLIAPALAARQWTNRLGTMLFLAAGFGVASGVTGSVLSSEVARLPTGPAIVLVATAFVVASLLFAPERGVVWAAIERARYRRPVVEAGLLADLRSLTRVGGVVSVAALAGKRGQPARPLRRQLRGLARRDLIVAAGDDAWRLTSAGTAIAEGAARRERLWKAYLGRQMELDTDGVHLSMDQIERTLPPETIALLERDLVAAASSGAIGVREPHPSSSPGVHR